MWAMKAHRLPLPMGFSAARLPESQCRQTYIVSSERIQTSYGKNGKERGPAFFKCKRSVYWMTDPDQ